MIGFVFSPIGRWLSGVLVVLAVIGGAYTKGRIDGRASYKAKIQRQIEDAIQKGEQGRADALRDLDAGSVPDSWWRN